MTESTVLVQAGKALSEPPAAADDALQLAKASNKTRSTTAKTSEPGVADVKLAKPSRKAGSATAKTVLDLGPEPAHDASELAKPLKKTTAKAAKSSNALEPEQADAAAKLAKPLKTTAAKTVSSNAASKAAANGAPAEPSGSSEFPADTSKGLMAAATRAGLTSAQANKQSQSQSQTDQTAVLASQAADATLSADSVRAQSGNEADAELSPATEKRRSKREATVSRSKSKAKGQVAPAKVVLPSYKQLKSQMPADGQMLPIPPISRKAIKVHIRAFRGSAYVQDQALALYVNSQVLMIDAKLQLSALVAACSWRVVVHQVLIAYRHAFLGIIGYAAWP